MSEYKKIVTSVALLGGVVNVVSPSLQTSASLTSFLKKAGSTVFSAGNSLLKSVGVFSLISFIKNAVWSCKKHDYKNKTEDNDSTDDSSEGSDDTESNIKINKKIDENVENEIILNDDKNEGKKKAEELDLNEKSSDTFNFSEKCMEIFNSPEKFEWRLESVDGKNQLYVNFNSKGSFISASRVFAECKKCLEEKLKNMPEKELLESAKVDGKSYLKDSFGRIKTEKDRLSLEIAICSFMQFASCGNPWAVLSFGDISYEDLSWMERVMGSFWEGLVKDLDWSENKSDQEVRNFINAISFRMGVTGNFNNIKERYCLAGKILKKSYNKCKDAAKKKIISNWNASIEKENKELKNELEDSWKKICNNLTMQKKDKEEISKIEKIYRENAFKRKDEYIDSKNRKFLVALGSGKILLNVSKADIVENIANNFFDENGFLKLDFDEEDDYENILYEMGFNDLVDYGESVGAKLERIDDAKASDEENEEEKMTDKEVKKRSTSIVKGILEDFREENEKRVGERSKRRVESKLLFENKNVEDDNENKKTNKSSAKVLKEECEVLIAKDLVLNAFYSPRNLKWELKEEENNRQHLFVSLDGNHFMHVSDFFEQCKNKLKFLQKKAREAQDYKDCFKKLLYEADVRESDEKILETLRNEGQINENDVVRIETENNKKKVFKQISFKDTGFEKDIDFCSFMEFMVLGSNPWGLLNVVASSGESVLEKLNSFLKLILRKHALEKYTSQLELENFQEALKLIRDAKNQLEKSGVYSSEKIDIIKTIFPKLYNADYTGHNVQKLREDFLNFCDMQKIKLDREVGNFTEYFRKKPKLKSDTSSYEEKKYKGRVNSENFVDSIFGRVQFEEEENHRKKELEDKRILEKEEQDREKDISRILNKKSANNVLLWTMKTVALRTAIVVRNKSKRDNINVKLENNNLID